MDDPSTSVIHSLEGCPKKQTVAVTIDNSAVAGSPFTVPKSSVLSATVPFVRNTSSHVLKVTCSRPYFTDEVTFGP